MIDPLSEVIALLRPRAVFSKRISGAGRWGVSTRPTASRASARCCRGNACSRSTAMTRSRSQRATSCCSRHPGLRLSGFEPVVPDEIDPRAAAASRARCATAAQAATPDMRLLGGYFAFDAPDPVLVAAVLPAVIHVRGTERLSTLVELVGDESIAERPGRELVLTRLVEVLLVEALRAAPGDDAPAGLLRGLADARLAPALRELHGHVARSWTVPQLARVGRALTLGVLRALHAHRRPAADGVPARLAHGAREGPPASPGARARRDRRARRLRLGEQLQHRVQPLRGSAAEPVRQSGLGALREHDPAQHDRAAGDRDRRQGGAEEQDRPRGREHRHEVHE